jgi:hypothetical protein
VSNDEKFELWTVESLEETDDDIVSIAEFIEEITGDEHYGDRFQDTANRVLLSLNIWPKSHQKYSDEYDDNIRRIEIPGYKAAIIYKTYKDTLEVIAVMAFHTLTDPDEYNRIISERVAIADKKLGNKEE